MLLKMAKVSILLRLYKKKITKNQIGVSFNVNTMIGNGRLPRKNCKNECFGRLSVRVWCYAIPVLKNVKKKNFDFFFKLVFSLVD